ncbi:hypothetical protein AB6A40_007377 [Gnathostoma spinigerum]|uniref:Uncharacterized protein n=1 Tax=Gnathostoma spinigerum TaxID=75299 RepID=A0ABD6EUE7_9BILA
MTNSAFILCIALLTGHLLDKSASFVPTFFHGRHRDGFLEGGYRRNSGNERNENINENITRGYFKQKLDHFGSDNTEWNQDEKGKKWETHPEGSKHPSIRYYNAKDLHC